MSRIERKNAVKVGDLVQLFLKQGRLSAGMNTHLVFSAWNSVSGAGEYTVNRFFRSGTLYVTVNSSVVRSQLMMQKDILLEKMNALLAGDELFSADNPVAGYVKKLVIK